MQFAEEFTARRLNAYAEAEQAREIELRRVIAERKALAKEQRTTTRRARRSADVVVAPEASAIPETVTVETILASAPPVPAGDEQAPLVDSEARRELHAMVR
ncbi:hypothetical protein [Diaminobutyricibacter sp. McL0608]|uniref:hypothetical protein n=1 Tax=Leifsonia sp. McL0608 TaxID=3143537 RepID=UPI0031F2FCCB